MPTILKIGYHSFLIENPKDAAAALKALAGAIPLDSRYRRRDHAYFPAKDADMHEITMKTIRVDQLFAADPGEVDMSAPSDPSQPAARQHPDARPIKRLKDAQRLLGY